MPDGTEQPDDGFRLVPAITDPAPARRLHAANVPAWDEAAAAQTGSCPTCSTPSRKHERSWTFADMLNPLVDAGLRIERLGEHREEYFDALPNLRAEEKARIPFSFTLLARCPG